jgi:uncharacterized SAM-binding protein YcdF (DUF218 family)
MLPKIPRTRQEWLKLLRICAILTATAVTCILIMYFSIPMSDTPQAQFDVILVLGNPAADNGSIAPLAKSRVLEGIRQYHAGVAPRIMMTGGAVRNQFVESQVMMQFARSQGVPASALYTEEDSRNTIQNAYYSYRILQANGWTSALVVTSPTHVRRASLIFNHYPLAWRMDVAPWPPDYPLWKKMWFWTSETGYTAYGRLFGFPNAHQFLPHTNFRFPRL